MLYVTCGVKRSNKIFTKESLDNFSGTLFADSAARIYTLIIWSNITLVNTVILV